MRRLIASLFVASMISGCASAPPQPPLEVVNVLEVPGRSQRDICNAARDWVALNFKDSKAVIEVFDAEQGKLIGKGRVTLVAIVDPAPTDFTMLIECKDGRARATFADFQPTLRGQPYPLTDYGMVTLRTQAASKAQSLSTTLGDYLRNPKVGAAW